LKDKDIDKIKKLQKDFPGIEPITSNDSIGKSFSKSSDIDLIIQQLEQYIHGCIEDGEKKQEIKKEINEYIDNILNDVKKNS